MTAEDGPTLTPVRAAHRFDQAALVAWLEDRLEGVATGAAESAADGLSIAQFQGGQSNPTFLLTAKGGRRYVLRKQPPGALLPKAHQIDREYRVQAALAGTGAPAPRMRLYCADADIIGTAFYVMDFVPGRVFDDPRMVPAPRSQRRAMCLDAVGRLATLHQLDWRALGLEDFGRPAGYLARQTATWTKQYAASTAVPPLAPMPWVAAWLEERVAVDDAAAIVHGDYRIGNVLLHPERPEVVAILDWELATIGHPLADLAYFCLPYYLPAGARGVIGVDLTAQNLPSEAELVARYCSDTGRDGVANWPVFVVFSLYRLAAILQGVASRAAQGNASDARAHEVGAQAGVLADAAERLARESG